ncbi:transposase domain-containing protein, partial [Escherichia coli]|uniref:transposase domain-containing protein n=1 Tax=Escherichia coli TaxID=562 RepID=UPI0037545BAD
LVTCKLNEVEPENWLREVIVKLNDWPSNRVHELLPWNVSVKPMPSVTPAPCRLN